MGLNAAPRRTWNDAVVRWCHEQAHKATAEEDKATLRWLDAHLSGKELDTINRDMVERITQAKLADRCSNATVNRTLALVRSILRRCVREWQWLDRAPAVRMLNEPIRRIRFLTHDEADLLLAELPPHLRDMAAFSLESGLRAANVTGLRWSAVDLGRRLAWVFTFKAQPIVQVSTAAWYNASQRAGIDHFRWHDLRHTWASWHVQSGTPLNVLQELGGWASYSMVQRYAHLAADRLAPWADRLNEAKNRHGTNPSQRPAVQRVA